MPPLALWSIHVHLLRTRPASGLGFLLPQPFPPPTGTPSPRGGLQPRGLPLTLAQGTDRASPCRSPALSAGFTQMRPVSVPQGRGSDTSSIGSGSGGWKWRPRCTLYETFNDLRKRERRAQGRHKGQRDRIAAQKLTGRLCQRVWGGAEAS